MPSKMHQMIIGLIGRKMREKGYEIIAFDGKEYKFEGNDINIPFTIKNHRPDIIGYDFNTKNICIGEAKTLNDLCTKRTKKQLTDFANVKSVSENKIELIIGIPKTAKNDLIKLLTKLNLHNNNKISYIWLPEELVNND